MCLKWERLMLGGLSLVSIFLCKPSEGVRKLRSDHTVSS